MRAGLIFVLGLVSLLGLAQSFERHMAVAEEAAPVDSLASAGHGGPGITFSCSSTSTMLLNIGPVGSCSRCGRKVYGAWTDKNATLDIHDPRTGSPLWHGCTECLYELLRRNP